MEQNYSRTDDSLENDIRTYSGMVYRLAFSQTRNKCDADDIFQEVFLRYIREKPQFETEEHKKAWLIPCHGKLLQKNVVISMDKENGADG